MELKTRYQYTYFIYPYTVDEVNYIAYLKHLLANKKITLKKFQKEKDNNIYTYFLPKIKEYMFKSFEYTKETWQEKNKKDINKMAKMLAKEPCTVFEYNLKKEIQGKTGEQDGIFFKIEGLKIICFNTGICFLCIKTNLDDISDFADILNFNYKFSTINQENNKLNDYDNIRIQTNAFKDVKSMQEFIKEIIGPNAKAERLDIETEKFLTYSYVCIDQEAWDNSTKFNDIQNSFTKYINILPNDNNINYNTENAKILENLKYAKIGITKMGIMLFCSTADMNNYTKLPQSYENEYLYTYIFALYQKIYLKKVSEELDKENRTTKARKKFINFTKNLLKQEITSNEIGTAFYNKLKEALETESLYNKTKEKYDVLYKNAKIEKNRKANRIIFIAIVVCLAANIINFITLLAK